MKELIEKMHQKITPKRLAIFLILFYSASLIPLLWIGWYNYPSADDYTIGNNCRHVWVSSHNLFKVIWCGILKAMEDWAHWMGYFTSNFLMAMPPNIFGERVYVLTVWIMLAMLSFSTIYLLRNIFIKVFQADKYVSCCAAVIMLFVTVQCMVGRVEAFYWYSGAVNYMFVHSLSLFFYGLLIAAVYDQGKKRVLELTVAAILGFFIGGGNQLTALNVAVIMVAVIGFLFYKRKWKEYRIFAAPIALFFIGFFLNVAAPGNWIRAEETNGMNPVKAVLVSFYYCLYYCLGEWLSWPIVIMVVILIVLFWHMTKRTKFCFRYPLGVVFFGYCVVSAMMTPSLFATGSIEAARLQALTFTMYLLVLTLCVGYVTGWVRQSLEEKGFVEEDKGSGEVNFSGSGIWCLLGCLVFFVFATILTVIPDSHYFTASSAITDLVSGDAKAYGDAMRERLELYSSGEKNVVVSPLPCRPKLLYFSEVREDPENWENIGVCRYYELNSLTVKEK